MAFLRVITIAFVFLFSHGIYANLPPDREQNTRMLINLLDYIGKDYVNAVVDGAVVNAYEFDEMREFAEKSLLYYHEITRDQKISNNDSLITQFRELRDLIEAKSNSNIISVLSTSIKNEILKLNFVRLSPDTWPDLIEGRKLYIVQCSACHGENGDGKGSAAKEMTPQPTDFTDHELMKTFSPFQAYNVIQTGIPGTSMISYSQMTDDEIWSLAFYVNSIPFGGPDETATSVPEISLLDAATLNDTSLVAQYSLSLDEISSIRNYSFKLDDTPLQIASRFLDEAVSFYEKGDKAEARNKALKAYLEGIEPVENRITASDNKLVNELEKSMMGIRTGIQNDISIDQLKTLTIVAQDNIRRAEILIGGQENSLGFTAFMSASILLREGLEAFLIIIAIIGILKSMEAKKAVRWVHSGWITAVLVGIGSWFFTDQLINWGAQRRELMEGLIALFAVTVLLYIGFWMHRKTEMSRWKSFIEDKVKGLVKKNNLIGLAVFSFLVVFREAFESVIFLSSWSLETGEENQAGIWSGVAIAATALVIISWALMKFINKIPLRKFFLYFSVIVVFMAVILTGEGIHALQESGYSTVTSVPLNLRFGMLGIYPTLETMLGQVVIIGLIIFLWKANTLQIKKASPKS